MKGSLRERSPGVWELRVFLGNDPVTGKKRNVSRTFRGGKRDAQTALSRLVTEQDNPQTDRRRKLAPAKMTLTGLLTAYLDQHEGSPGTIQSYRSALGKHIAPTIGRLPISQLDARILDQFYKHLRDEADLAPSSIRSVHALIRGALRRAVVWGWLPANVARDARPPTVRRGEIHLPDASSIVLALELADTDDPDFGVFLRLAAATGARRGELCALKWSAIDLDTGMFRVDTSAVAVVGSGIQVKDTKTHIRRGVTLDDDTVNAIREHQRRMNVRCAATSGHELTPDMFVFSHAAGFDRTWRPERVSSRWATLRDKVGLEGVRLHDLRHFQATMLLRSGVPVKNVSKRLGHRDAATTLNVYAQFLEDEDRRSADVIGGMLTPTDSTTQTTAPTRRTRP